MDLIEISEHPAKLLCCDAAQAYAVRAGSDVVLRLERALEPARVLASPKRVRIVAALHELGELCVRDAAVIGDISIALASHHLKALHEAGVVERRRDGKLSMYRLSPRGIAFLTSLLEDAP